MELRWMSVSQNSGWRILLIVNTKMVSVLLSALCLDLLKVLCIQLPMIVAKSSQVMNKSINPSIVKVTLPSHIIPGSVDKIFAIGIGVEVLEKVLLKQWVNWVFIVVLVMVKSSSKHKDGVSAAISTLLRPVKGFVYSITYDKENKATTISIVFFIYNFF
jgi:hypothetical protein